MNLKQKVISGLKWTSFSSVIVALMQVLQLIVLAKILGPEAYGTMAILNVVVGFSTLFVDLGISKIIIHKQDNITENQLNSLYWFNIILALFIYIVVYVSSNSIANFYNNTDLEFLLQLLATTFIIKAFAIQYNVILQKEMLFKYLEIISIVTVFLNFVVALLFAIKGYGVISLIYATIISSMVSSILTLYYGSRFHKIKFYFSFLQIKEFFSFGLYWTGSKFLGNFAGNIDVIILGKVFDQQTLGIYHIAKQLVLKPSQILLPVVTKVSYPIFGKIQNDISKTKDYYLGIIGLLSFVIFPVYGLLFLLSSEIVNIFLGSEWIDSISIIQSLVFYAAIIAIGTPIGSLIMAKGKANWNFWWNVFWVIFVAVLMMSVYSYGIVVVAISISLSQFILTFVGFKFMVSKLIDVSFLEYYKNIFLSLSFSLLSLIVVYIGTYFVNFGLVISIIYKLVVFIIVYLSASYLFNKEIIFKLKGLVKR
ncbi:MOP flippase family protein [Aliarcobacter butzleri]|uniref:MOP flippase family protein n=1 Tax=Aliarcobacter butzleri TaxID=28197 RepID=UPI003AF94C1C